MTTKHITRDGVTLKVRYPVTAKSRIFISIDDPNNRCVDNNYNGDYATIDLTIADVRKLHAHLTQILDLQDASKQAKNKTNGGN